MRFHPRVKEFCLFFDQPQGESARQAASGSSPLRLPSICMHQAALSPPCHDSMFPVSHTPAYVSDSIMKSALLRPALPGLALCASLFLTACTTPYSEAPVATNFPSSKQHKLQAGAHWNVIANDAASTLVSSIRLGKGCIAAYPDCNRLVLRPPKEPTAFARGFHTLLATALVNQGVQLAPDAASAMMLPASVTTTVTTPASPRVVSRKNKPGKASKTSKTKRSVIQRPASVQMVTLTPPAPLRQELEVDIQVVKFSPGRLDGRYFVSGTALSTGVWGLRGLWTQTSPQGAGVGVALGMTFDAYRWFSSEFARGPLPQLEMIVTVSALSNGIYIGRVSNLYYLSDNDLSLYVPATPTPVYINGGA